VLCDICNSDDCYHITKQNEKPWDVLDSWIYKNCPDCNDDKASRPKCPSCDGFGTIRFQCRDLKVWKPKPPVEEKPTVTISLPKKPADKSGEIKLDE